jgi:uncharacterized protein
MSKYIIKQNKKGNYSFLLLAPNGQVIAMSQEYATLAATYHAIESVKKYSQTEIVEEHELK